MAPLAVLALSLLLPAWNGHASSEQSSCQELGFTGYQSCSDCELLGSYVKDPELVQDCQSCCVVDKDSTRFSSATLEVCPMRIGGYPEIEKFISKEAPKYAPALKVSMRYNYPPQLVLRAKGVPTATTHIANWNVATIKAFLDQKLEQPAAAGEAAGKAAAAPSSS